MINIMEYDRMTLGEFINSRYYRDGFWELMRGELVAMSPARATHEILVSTVIHLLWGRIDEYNKKCRVGCSNAAVLYGEDSFVMPDAFVTYDASRLDENERFKIAPEIVIEILSKSTREYDCNEKLDLYRDAGADEYWIIDPENKSVTVHYFKSDEKHVFCVGDMIESKFLDIPCFKVEDIFRVR